MENDFLENIDTEQENMKSNDIQELKKWLINLTKEKRISKTDIEQILNDFNWDTRAIK